MRSLARAQEFQIETLRLEREDAADAILIATRFQQFILLHDLGHATMGHVGDRDRFAMTSVAGVEVPSLSPGHAREYEADAFAASHFYSPDFH